MITEDILLKNGFELKDGGELKEFEYRIDRDFLVNVAWYKGNFYCFDISHHFEGGCDYIHKCSSQLDVLIQCLEICGLNCLAYNLKQTKNDE